MTETELVAFIAASYALDPSDIKQISALLLAAYLASMQGAYRRAAAGAGLSTSSASRQWQAPTPNTGEGSANDLAQALVDQLQQQAEAHAKQIAASYTEALGDAATTVADAWQQAGGDGDALDDVTKAMGQWADARGTYKSGQIANVECGIGGEAGIDAFIFDLTHGTLIDAATGEVLDVADLALAVLPPESSSDTCKDYAGRLFDIQGADALPEFPLHPNCPHYRTVVPV